MSPVCVSTIFEGDNGGATARGVTETAIRVGVTMSGTSNPPTVTADDRAAIQAMFDYFNLRYELYGRRLEPVFVAQNGTIDAPAQRSQATEAAAMNLFGLVSNRESNPAYVQELARNKVVSILGDPSRMLASDRALFDELHPFVWSAFPSYEAMSRNLADFYCRSLAGKPSWPANLGGAAGPVRKLGVITGGGLSAPPPSRRPFVDALAAGCGVTAEAAEVVATGVSSTAARTAIDGFKNAGVTTVMCLCHDYSVLSSMTASATNASFSPEWVFLPFYADELYFPSVFFKPAQRARLMSLLPQGRLMPPQTLAWYQAVVQVAPATAPTIMARHRASNVAFEHLYRGLLVLAAGVQGAGPELSADAFAQALMATEFSNAGAGEAPYWQPSVGFGPGDHGFIDDFAVAAWNPTIEPPIGNWYAATGSWCYLDGGRRYSSGSFPTDAGTRLYELDPATCR